MKFFKNHFPFCFVSSKNHFGGCTHTFTFSTSFPELAAQLTYMITREKYLSRFFFAGLVPSVFVTRYQSVTWKEYYPGHLF